MNEICQRCNEDDQDRRTLWMACFYAMDELDLPFQEQEIEKRKFFTLRVCKECRAEWMSAIKSWFQSAKIERKQVGSGIFIRENGATREISEKEWNEKYPGRIPHRVINEPQALDKEKMNE